MTEAANSTVTLENPITRGEQTIGFVQIRRPMSGELRGLSLVDLIRLEVGSLQTLLPRITVPPLTAEEVSALPPADLFAMANEVASFLLPKESTDSLAQ